MSAPFDSAAFNEALAIALREPPDPVAFVAALDRACGVEQGPIDARAAGARLAAPIAGLARLAAYLRDLERRVVGIPAELAVHAKLIANAMNDLTMALTSLSADLRKFGASAAPPIVANPPRTEPSEADHGRS